MAIQFFSAIAEWIHGRIDVITSEVGSPRGLQRSAYRFPLDKEPECEGDGLYYVDCSEIPEVEPHYGTGEKNRNAVATVRVSFLRPGGDLEGGDRQTAMRNAADDVQRIADVVEDPEGYDLSLGIQHVNFRGAHRIVDAARHEIWEIRFDVQWRSDEVTT